MNQSLPTSTLGKTGLQVTKLGYGTAISKFPDEVAWGRLLNEVLDSGINIIDTANDYGVGWGLPAESVIGRQISHRRSEFIIATKCGCSSGDRDNPNWSGEHIWTRENAYRGLHESLERLNTDYIDIMQYHNPTVEDVEKSDLVQVLNDMRSEGKVRWIGVSTTLPHLPVFLEMGVFDVFQIPYSALERDHENWIEKSETEGMGIIVRGGVAQGEPGVGSGDGDIWQKFDEAALNELLDDGDTKTSLILRYTLTHPGIHTNIVGTSKQNHLRENIAGINKGPLDQDVYSEMKVRLDSVGIMPFK